MWELLAWALPQTFRLRHEPCDQCRGSDSSRSSAQSAILTNPDALLDRQACPWHCLAHVAYEVELRGYIHSYGTPGWPGSGLAVTNRSVGTQLDNRMESFGSIMPSQRGEPDLQTMYHLVYESKLRPQLPQVVCGSWTTGLLVQHQARPSWIPVEPVTSSGPYGELNGSRNSVPRCHSTIPECGSVGVGVHLDFPTIMTSVDGEE
ncbi:unnamed protein product [Echinostoma caproni]|uniref:Uncharacterized protein n=1 Tax=Echinostoma caproni TaxID=27848 RepID=A0A3P8HI59_9TREM|nr:unnamed protein product [Echinostoma caproni]